MASGCVTLKANTHFPKSKKGSFFGERIKESFNNSIWVKDQLNKRFTTQKNVKHVSLSAILTSDDPKGSLVSSISFRPSFFASQLSNPERKEKEKKTLNFVHYMT
jgi:hypothetical protein